MKLLPFRSLHTCPACNSPLYAVNPRYSTDRVEDKGNGAFQSIRTFGDSIVPHLEKHCACGFGWLEEVSDPEAIVK